MLALLARKKSVSKGDSLLVVGPPDAGKTAILSTVRQLHLTSTLHSDEDSAQLAYNQTLPTHTSMQTNASIVTLPSSGKTFRVVDVPGHPRIRDQFEEHLLSARAVIFVVDTSTVSRVGPAVAECVL